MQPSDPFPLVLVQEEVKKAKRVFTNPDDCIFTCPIDGWCQVCRKMRVLSLNEMSASGSERFAQRH